MHVCVNAATRVWSELVCVNAATRVWSELVGLEVYACMCV
jgi:hypothetical protein